MADLGICSRREADYLIAHGWVMVNGQIIDQLGSKVEISDEITLSKAAQLHLDQKISILMYKPVGFVCHASEEGYEHVFDLLHPDNCVDEDGKRVKDKGLAPVGRLDIDSRGLLILSQDGTIAKKIIGEDSKVPKTYIVKTDSALSEQDLKLLKQGNAWEQKGVLKPVGVKVLRDTLYEITLYEGKNRQIRRMLECLEKNTLMLKRIKIGNLSIDGLEEGQWRKITAEEKSNLMKW